MYRFSKLLALALAFASPGFSGALAQDSTAAPKLDLPALEFAAPETAAKAGKFLHQLTLAARLAEGEDYIERGLVWRIFKPEAKEGEKLPLVATANGGTTSFDLEPGSYLVHAAFGRAGVTKRITIDNEARKETIVLDAGGLKLSAVAAGGARIPAAHLRFAVYQGQAGADGERALIIPDVKPDTIVRLNSGTYHIVSTYGSVNAIIRADIQVEAGKMTEASVEHKAAELTLKLVRAEGGEAMADTAWSVVNPSGEIIKESVGAFASHGAGRGRLHDHRQEQGQAVPEGFHRGGGAERGC